MKDVLEIYLNMMNEIESDELVTALERIVAFYKEDMEPFALMLSKQLTDSYHKLIQVDARDDGGESAIAALGCVTALTRIIRSCKSNQMLLAKIEEIIYSVLQHALSPDGVACLEEASDCISLLVYYSGGLSGSISKNMWRLYPQLMFVVTG